MHQLVDEVGLATTKRSCSGHCGSPFLTFLSWKAGDQISLSGLIGGQAIPPKVGLPKRGRGLQPI